jgi:hypothetical protein
MQKKSLNSKSLLLVDIKNKLRSFVAIQRNGWIVKLSTYQDSNILLLFLSAHTGQAFVRYFVSEDDAVDYINMVVSRDSTDLLEIE